MISLDLYGDPVAQSRPRFARCGDHVKTYDDKSRLKEGCKWQLKAQYRNEPLESPLFVDVTFFMPIPKSTSGVRKRQMLNGVMYHMKKPDLDNLAKFLWDCLNGIVIRDDSQIVETRIRKVYSEKPGTLVRIQSLNEQTLGKDDEIHSRENRGRDLSGHHTG